MANVNQTTPTAENGIQTFAPFNTQRLIFFAYAPIIFGPMSIIVNIWIIFVFCKRSVKVPSHHRFMYLTIAVADIMAGVGRQIMLVWLGDGLLIVSGNKVIYYFSLLSDFNCVISQTIWAVGETISGYTMLVFCVERYLSISRPLKVKILFSFKRTLLYMFILQFPIQVYVFSYNILIFRPVESVGTAAGKRCTGDLKISYALTLLTINHLVLKYGHMLPTFIVNVLLLMSIRQANKKRIKLIKGMSQSETVTEKREIATAIIILLASFVTAIAWVPESFFSGSNFLLGTLAINSPDIKTWPFFLFVGEWHAISLCWLVFSHVFNFYIYLAKMPQFRKALISCP